ncbi:MAG TPA: PKD domain-containing protein [Acidobacteriota bacterium]|nr:PKD domain-containing protein [Acidobacteriota bacterium]
MRFVRILPLVLLLSSLPSTSAAQYVFLDANGDGRNDASDQLNPTGVTEVDVWIWTNENRDGSPASCVTDPSEPLSINSYTVALKVLNGAIEFGPMTNRMSFSVDQPACFATYEDTTSTTHYHNGWGYRDIFPPGRHRVASLTLRVLDGHPTLVLEGRSSAQPSDVTGFGTQCSTLDFDNTFVLGEEFVDAGGIGPPIAEAGGPYYGTAGRPIRFNGSRSLDPDGMPLDFRWTFDDGTVLVGAVVEHAFATVGHHTVTLLVTSESGSDDDVADVDTVEPFLPVANAGGPYQGRPGATVPFNGGASFDPDNDPLTFQWSFGNGSRATGAYPHYAYADAGTYEVRLRVSDGLNFDEDVTTATIAEPVNHAPVARAGGPYEGIVGRWIEFRAIGSSDADGDFMTYRWDFGDGKVGAGIVSSHAYRAPGAFEVVLTVFDGLTSSSAATGASIRAAYGATAFFEGGRTIVPLDDPSENIVVRFEPSSEVRLAEFDPDLVVLRVATTSGGVVEVPAAPGVTEHDDSDGNGIVEFAALFPRDRFRELADAGEIRGRVDLELTGGLYGGGSYVGALEATFIRNDRFDLTVTPNPFNPQARLTIFTKTGGPVTAHLYNVHGRRVRTLFRDEPMKAGRHDLVIEARDDAGRTLASGVYFMRLVAPDGAITGRIVVAK